MAPQENEGKCITRSQVDPAFARNKQARYAAVRCVQAAGRESNDLCGERAQWAIGATRCDDKCANTALA